MKKLLYLILTAVIISSCGRKSTTETSDADSIIRIDLLSEAESEFVKISDIVSDLEYIPLQTTENSLIKSITKIVTRKNKIYIKNGLNDILCFDKEGNFLYSLNKTGRGPGEYTHINDFDISSDDNTLIILTYGSMMEFNNTDTAFNYTKTINFKEPFPSKVSLVPMTNNILISIDPATGSEQSLSILINIDGDTLYSKPNNYRFENSTSGYRMANESLHYNYDKSVCFKEEFSDTVFFVNEKSMEFQPRLIFDSHGKGFRPRIRYDREYAKSHGAEMYWVYLINETPRYIIYKYEHNLKRYNMFFNKSTKNKLKIAQQNYGEEFTSNLKDDLSGGPALNLNFCSENILYSSIDALTLKQYVNSEDFRNAKVSYPEKKEELKKLADSLDE